MAERDDQNDERTGSEQDQGTGGVQGQCSCPEWPISNLPGTDQPIRRLLKALEDKYVTSQDSPSDATKKFGDDLKTFEKEYLAINDLVTKYQAIYEKLDCDLAAANGRKAELTGWCNRVDQPTRLAITQLWNTHYEKVENDACKAWVSARRSLRSSQDCLHQAEKQTEQAKEDFDTVKNLEKSLKDGFSALEALFERGKKLNDTGNANAVCAVSLEFCAAYNKLGVLDTYYNREKCGQTAQSPEEGRRYDSREQPAVAQEQASVSPCDAKPQLNLKDAWSPENFRKELISRLRAWILQRLQFYLWSQQRTDLENATKKTKEALDRIKKTRQDEFIREAEDIIVARRGA